MLTIQGKLACDHANCLSTEVVTIKLYEDRIMDGALGDNYPVFMEVVNPPDGWTVNETRYIGSYCPKHKPKPRKYARARLGYD